MPGRHKARDRLQEIARLIFSATARTASDAPAPPWRRFSQISGTKFHTMI